MGVGLWGIAFFDNAWVFRRMGTVETRHNINQKAQAVMKGIKMITVIQQGAIFKGFTLYAYSDFESICMAFASRNIFLTLGNLEF